MKLFFDEAQRLHNPVNFLASGAPQPNPEQPGRVQALLDGAKAAGLTQSTTEDHGMGPIARVHSAEYVHFLQHIYKRWQRIEGGSAEVIPNIHPDRRTVSYPKSAVGQAGFHMADTACPISEHTFHSAYWSAQTAMSATNDVLAGAKAAYALCRPPGHHAFSDLAGGFCFFNNSAIAAAHLKQNGLRAAIVDVDLHHGNGTQGIFYGDRDVLTVSIHADPIRYYPFFWGHAHERGEGDALGTNLNLPLKMGTGDEGFLDALDKGLERVQQFGTDIVVVALGLDAFEGDPFGGLSVSQQGFAEIGKRFAQMDLPCVMVQEGGYLCDELGDNLTAFMSGFQGG
ncbi:histone deacetylase family protein [Maritalea mediterranea]|uniref:Histone deacetylase family protein n=1 Tax=Maritalea mediterranea TaxID=2909667 RepID=A0ABS9EAJ4_9HYPH|nr:histone deacetylase family protein [Maritalea mediterranea]MCF4099217.1 histone deacetylase family protein [Maritalea mediterranea]